MLEQKIQNQINFHEKEQKKKVNRILSVRVDLEPFFVNSWFENMRVLHDTQKSNIDNIAKIKCGYCLTDVTNLPYIKCTECKKIETFLCVKCFKLGAEGGKHLRGHNYEIKNKDNLKMFMTKNNFKLFENDNENDAWSVNEDLTLLTMILKGKIEEWPEVSKTIGPGRTIKETNNRINRFFLRSKLGDFVLNLIKKDSNKFAFDEENNEINDVDSAVTNSLTNEKLQILNTTPQKTNQLNTLNPIQINTEKLFTETKKTEIDYVIKQSQWTSPITTKKLSFSFQKSENRKRKLSDTIDVTDSVTKLNVKRKCIDKPVKSEFSPQIEMPSLKKLALRQFLTINDNFEKKDDSNIDLLSDNEILKPTLSRRRSNRTNTAKILKKDAFLTQTPSPSLKSNDTDDQHQSRNELRRREIFETAKNETNEAIRGLRRKSSLQLSEALNISDSAARRLHKSSAIMSEEKIIELRSKFSDPYFYKHKPNKLNEDILNNFNIRDLQLLGYMPFRDEFENEYKNEAEQLISRISFHQLSYNYNNENNEVEDFHNAARLARIERYNRILKIRIAKHNIIQEHDLLNEYLSIAKNNLNEKGKYNVFAEKYFHSKKKEDEYKPLFCQLRQVANRDTVEMLAKNVGKMETLMDQIEELKQLQNQGIQHLKGRLKSDTTPVWTKKRRIRKVDNPEIRKANLRWKRILRWSNKQSSETE